LNRVLRNEVLVKTLTAYTAGEDIKAILLFLLFVFML
jgi:hypothetical protein